MSAAARFIVRAALVGISAANASLLTALMAGEALDARAIGILASIGLGSALAYAGIGAAVPQVEPHIGNEMPEA